MAICKICRERYNANGLRYCPKCMNDSARVGAILGDKIADLRKKLRSKNATITGLIQKGDN